MVKPYVNHEGIGTTIGSLIPSEESAESQIAAKTNAKIVTYCNKNESLDKLSTNITIYIQLFHPSFRESEPFVQAQRSFQSVELTKYRHSRDKENFGMFAQERFSHVSRATAKGS